MVQGVIYSEAFVVEYITKRNADRTAPMLRGVL